MTVEATEKPRGPPPALRRDPAREGEQCESEAEEIRREAPGEQQVVAERNTDQRPQADAAMQRARNGHGAGRRHQQGQDDEHLAGRLQPDQRPQQADDDIHRQVWIETVPHHVVAGECRHVTKGVGDMEPGEVVRVIRQHRIGDADDRRGQ